ncbi:MAG: hypothetical protein JJU18_05710 [Oceanicaulis sp.]|nr:hypothetical protein [Oceanicaulis sp.]
MRGQFVAVWPAVWREVFRPLVRHAVHGDSCAIELYRALVPQPFPPGDDPRPPADAYDENGELADPEWIEAERSYQDAMANFDIERSLRELILNDPKLARKGLRPELAKAISSEYTACRVLEASFEVATEFGEDFSNRHFIRIRDFIARYSLRYELRRPLELSPSLPGVFAMLIRDLRDHCQTDAHLAGLLREFEEAFRDLWHDPSPFRIKTAISRQFYLAEALGCASVGEHGLTLGELQRRLDDQWPHPSVRAVLGNMYGFRSNYPGMGHAGNPASVMREIELRDLVATSIVLSGFSPYLSTALDANHIFRGE